MTLANKIESVRIQGFRSLADVELNHLSNAAALIGPNGSGKSNIIRFLEMLGRMMESPGRLGEFVARHGGADDQLFGGNTRTPEMNAEIDIRAETGASSYKFALTPTHPDRFIFTEEAFRFQKYGDPEQPWQSLGANHLETNLIPAAQGDASNPEVNPNMAGAVAHLLRNCAVFQFHNTSDTSGMKVGCDLTDSRCLSSHGGNLAAVLYRLEQEDFRRYQNICYQIGRILPSFDRFMLEPEHGKALLRWKPRGSEKAIGAHLTSDGALRLFALVTLLSLDPESLPDVILLDEPELGLHPSAIPLLGGMIKSLSTDKQVVVATQSPLLVDSFDLEQFYVLNLQDGRTTVNRPDANELQPWLEEFSTGELWRTNVLGGRP